MNSKARIILSQLSVIGMLLITLFLIGCEEVKIPYVDRVLPMVIEKEIVEPEFGVGHASSYSPREAAREATLEACAVVKKPHAIMVFAAVSNAQAPAVLEAIQDVVGDKIPVYGISCEGTFSQKSIDPENYPGCAVEICAIGGAGVKVSANLHERNSEEALGKNMAYEIRKQEPDMSFIFTGASIFAGKNKVDAAQFIKKLKLYSGLAQPRIFGAGFAGRFGSKAVVFAGDTIVSDGILLMNLKLGAPPVSYGFNHFKTQGTKYKITDAEHNKVLSLDGKKPWAVIRYGSGGRGYKSIYHVQYAEDIFPVNLQVGFDDDGFLNFPHEVLAGATIRMNDPVELNWDRHLSDRVRKLEEIVKQKPKIIFAFASSSIYRFAGQKDADIEMYRYRAILDGVPMLGMYTQVEMFPADIVDETGDLKFQQSSVLYVGLCPEQNDGETK